MNGDQPLHLQIMLASTRPERKGPAVAAWFEDRARRHAKFAVTLADLAEVNLPMLDEPGHPRLRNYTHDHTRRWSEQVAAADIERVK